MSFSSIFEHYLHRINGEKQQSQHWFTKNHILPDYWIFLREPSLILNTNLGSWLQSNSSHLVAAWSLAIQISWNWMITFVESWNIFFLYPLWNNEQWNYPHRNIQKRQYPSETQNLSSEVSAPSSVASLLVRIRPKTNICLVLLPGQPFFFFSKISDSNCSIYILPDQCDTQFIMVNL